MTLPYVAIVFTAWLVVIAVAAVLEIILFGDAEELRPLYWLAVLAVGTVVLSPLDRWLDEKVRRLRLIAE